MKPAFCCSDYSKCLNPNVCMLQHATRLWYPPPTEHVFNVKGEPLNALRRARTGRAFRTFDALKCKSDELQSLDGQGLHSLLKLYAPNWWLKWFVFVFFTLNICRWKCLGGPCGVSSAARCLNRRMLDCLKKRRLCLVGGAHCSITVNKEIPGEVCSLLPRYMCNIVQKCPMLSQPVGRQPEGSQREFVHWGQNEKMQNKCQIFFIASKISLWAKKKKNLLQFHLLKTISIFLVLIQFLGVL